MPEFDFAILGAGAIGSILGAHLARAGHRVAMLARGARAAYLEEHGLTLRGLTDFAAPVRTLRDPQTLHSAGALIVAIKTPAEKFSARFEGEARAVAALNHPHICQLYDVGPDYLVMEYVEGSEIKGPLPIEQALKAAIRMKFLRVTG